MRRSNLRKNTRKTFPEGSPSCSFRVLLALLTRPCGHCSCEIRREAASPNGADGAAANPPTRTFPEAANGEKKPFLPSRRWCIGYVVPVQRMVSVIGAAGLSVDKVQYSDKVEIRIRAGF